MPFYFDESIHERGGFILGAYAYGPNPDREITHALINCGPEPGRDEFKSSAPMAERPEMRALREELRGILSRDYLLGVMVMPFADRANLGREALVGLKKILNANRLSLRPVEAFFDEGIFSSLQSAHECAEALGLPPACRLHIEQDSRAVTGLQLADLVAHMCATMLLETLGLVTKQVKAGPDSGYDPDLELDLGFELWARLRYHFFNGGFRHNVQSNEEMVVEVASYGLHIADTCPAELCDAAV